MTYGFLAIILRLKVLRFKHVCAFFPVFGELCRDLELAGQRHYFFADIFEMQDQFSWYFIAFPKIYQILF